jgi:hypothetical protein
MSEEFWNNGTKRKKKRTVKTTDYRFADEK